MDYEKKYKETLEKARQLCAYPTSKPFISDLQDLFPELAESEDERIVKELLTFFRESVHGGHILTNKEYDSWIAWLEKQGQTFTKKDVDDAYLKGISDAKNELEKQGEKKPTVWNEEDEKAINDIMWIIEAYRKNGFNKKHIQMADSSEKWLKSLRPQPNYIQTKTDNRIRHEIINYLDCQKREEPTRKEKHDEWIEWLISKGKLPITMQQDNNWIERIEDILDWAEEKGRLSLSDCQDYSIMLSSFKHQNTWKPSDEQMNALDSTLQYSQVSHNSFEHLNSLFNDLKKLKR